MKVQLCCTVDVDQEVDVDIDDVLNEFSNRMSECSPDYWRGMTAAMDVMTRMMARIDEATIRAVPSEARKILIQRLHDEMWKWKLASEEENL